MKLADTAVPLATLLALASCHTTSTSPERRGDPKPPAAEVRAEGEPGAVAAAATRRARRSEERPAEDERVEAARKPFVEPLLPVKGPLQLPFDPAAPPTMLDLVRAYERVTDMRFVLRTGATDALKMLHVGLGGPLDVAPDAVQSTFESMIANQGLLLSVVHSGEPFLLSIDSSQTGDGCLHRSVLVDVEDLPRLKDHPALMIGTVAVLENLGGEEAVTAVRKLVASSETPPLFATYTSHAVFLSGRAKDVTSWVSWMRKMDRESIAPESASNGGSR